MGRELGQKEIILRMTLEEFILYVVIPAVILLGLAFVWAAVKVIQHHRKQKQKENGR